VDPSYWFWRGLIEMTKGITTGHRGIRQRRGNDESFYPRYGMAVIYLKAGRAVESVNEFERLLRAYTEDRALYPIDAVKALLSPRPGSRRAWGARRGDRELRGIPAVLG